MFGRATIRLGIRPHSSFECNGFVAARFRKKVSFAKKIVVTHCARAVYTARVAIHGTYTAVYTARSLPVVYMAGRPTGPCTRSQTARYGRVRPVTTVYTARSQLIHGSVYGRVRQPLHGRPTRAYVYTAVKRPCTRHVHVRVHG